MQQARVGRLHQLLRVTYEENSMSLRTIAQRAVQAACLLSLAAIAQPTPDNLKDDQIRTLISGKRLELRFEGAPPGPNFISHWDFRADGTLCARLIGSSPRTECADVGSWRTENNTVCWQLKNIGTTTGINSVCGRVRPGQGNLYEILDSSGRLGPTLFSIGK